MRSAQKKNGGASSGALLLAALLFVVFSFGAASRAVLQDVPVPVDEPDTAKNGESNPPGTDDIKEEFRDLSPFDYVQSCVPVNVLVLAQTDAERDLLGEEGDGARAPFGAWLSGVPGFHDALKTEVVDNTLFVSFVGANFMTNGIMKVVIYAPEKQLRGVRNSGIVGSLIVSGFSPSAEFGILNSSPIGALIVDDIEATEDTEIMARADGSGVTAVLGNINRITVTSQGTTGDILVDGVSKELNVDLQGTGDVIVNGAENVKIVGQYLGTAGIVSYTRGKCEVTSIFDEEYPTEELDENDVLETMAGNDPEGPYESRPDMIVTGCVRIPADADLDEEAPDIEQYMTWTCGLRVSGSFNCMAGDVEPIARDRFGVSVLGRASHGPPYAKCSEEIYPEEFLMSSVVEGMDEGLEDLRDPSDRTAKARETEALAFDVEEIQ